jgi:hypothetical protein
MRGTFVAKAVPSIYHDAAMADDPENDVWGEAKTGTRYVQVAFEIARGEHAGKVFTWRGMFGPKSAERTIESLRYCGARLADGDVFDLVGLSSNEVSIVLDEDTDEITGKTYTTVSWVNRFGASGIKAESRMGTDAKRSFRDQMRDMARVGAPPAPAAKVEVPDFGSFNVPDIGSFNGEEIPF